MAKVLFINLNSPGLESKQSMETLKAAGFEILLGVGKERKGRNKQLFRGKPFSWFCTCPSFLQVGIICQLGRSLLKRQGRGCDCFLHQWKLGGVLFSRVSASPPPPAAPAHLPYWVESTFSEAAPLEWSMRGVAWRGTEWFSTVGRQPQINNQQQEGADRLTVASTVST